MNTGFFTRRPRAPRKTQSGIALITSLLILVVVTLVAVAMYRSFGLQEKLAGNALEKQRATQAAQSALQYAEYWINLGNTGSGSACAGVVNGNVVANMKICSNPLADPGALPWSNRIEYKPPAMPLAAGGGINTNGANGTVGDINYATSPALYISYMGLGPDGKSLLYQVTGAGYGGSNTSASVVQSVYAMAPASKNLGGP